MKVSTIKKIIRTISFIVLIGSSGTIFAQILELEILGGGYKLEGPTNIVFTALNTGAASNTNTINFDDIGETAPSQAENNFLKVTDENGGNPFDIMISADEIKKSDPLETTVTPGSSNETINVTSSTGFQQDDTVYIVAPEDVNTITPSTPIYTISAITAPTSITLTEAISPPDSGNLVIRTIDCDYSPKKCIPLKNLKIRNTDGTSIAEAINGNIADFSLNSETNAMRKFGYSTRTLAGSSGSTLKVEDSSGFDINNEIIKFPRNTNIVPLENEIISITDGNTIILANPMTTAPEAGVEVRSKESRDITLANGTGAAPGEFIFKPSMQITVDAGQTPGTYTTTLYLTIV